MNRYIAYILLLLMIFLNSCSSTKHIGSNYRLSDDDSYIQIVIDNNKDFEYFYSKMRISASLSGKSVSANANLKIKNNSLIIYSVTIPLIGIEVIRMEIDSKEILLADKYNKRYVRIPLSESCKYLGWNVDYSELQALFMNDIFYISVSKDKLLPKLFSLGKSENTTVINAICEEPVLSFSIDERLKQIKSTEIRSENTGSLVWKYSNFEKAGERFYPSEMDITASTKSRRLNMKMKYSKISFEKSSMSRIDVSRYKAMDIDECIKSLGKYLDF